MSFKQAVNNSQSYSPNNISSTANGAPSLKSTMNPVLDLFAIAAALRGKPFNQYASTFNAAFNHDKRLTMQLILWLRDVREGAGERQTVRDMLVYMQDNYKQDALKMIPVLAEFGRWDDLLVFTEYECKELAYDTIVQALKSGNALCAKWMPRLYKMKKSKTTSSTQTMPGTYAQPVKTTKAVVNMNSESNQNRRKNNKIAYALMTKLGMNEKEYRKLLSGLSSTVEQQMCAREWNAIEYSKVPSLASTRYLPAFMKHDETRYREFLEGLAKGTTKINASVLYPYDVMKNLVGSRYSNPTVEQVKLGIAQWDGLKNFIEDSKVLPMVDTSSSMNQYACGDTKLSPKFMAVSLGLYIADKQKGAFKDMFLNFSTKPQVFQIKGNNIAEKAYDLGNNYNGREFWDGSTNLVGAFDEVLRIAVQNNLPVEDMPDSMIVFSDMEFNNNNSAWGTTPFKTVKTKFEQAGYNLPKVIFWNLDGRPSNNPVSSTDTGVVMVSGFSTNVLKTVLGVQTASPEQAMMETIDVERYQVF